jgi:hypothetical protein
VVRDEEIKRLIFYAKAMGVKVVIYNKDHPDGDAEWFLDGSLINVYAGRNTSKTDIVLSLIHELGHHVWFIHEKNRQPDLKIDEAITRENLTQKTDKKNPTPKHLRKKIYDVELAGIKWWHSIIKDTDIKIPEWKINFQMEIDIWMYEQYYETGEFPTGEKQRKKRKELKAKWKPKE